MSSLTLKNILNNYEQKRIKNLLIFEEKITDFYSKHPSIQKLTDNMNKTSIEISKTILLDKNNEEKLNLLNKHLNDLKKEKNNELKKLGISDDFFVPNFDCKLCSDTGYLENNQMCPCLKQEILNQEYNKSNISSLAFENFNNFSLNIFSDEKNEEKYNSQISPRENIKKIKEISLDFIKNFDDPKKKNLLFTGNTGLGKTYLTNCIANELLKNGKTVLYQTAPVMLDSVIDYKFGKNNLYNYNDLLTVDLLIIDDLGTENMNNIKFSEFFNILNTRLLNQNHHITKTIISTNLSLNNLFKTYDERIFSRLVGYYDICKFFGEDLRFKK